MVEPAASALVGGPQIASHGSRSRAIHRDAWSRCPSGCGLEVDDVRLPVGSILTDNLAAMIVELALARHRRCPSISGAWEHTPGLSV